MVRVLFVRDSLSESVGRGWFGVVDDQEVQASGGGFESEAELLLGSGEDRCDGCAST